MVTLIAIKLPARAFFMRGLPLLNGKPARRQTTAFLTHSAVEVCGNQRVGIWAIARYHSNPPKDGSASLPTPLYAILHNSHDKKSGDFLTDYFLASKAVINAAQESMSLPDNSKTVIVVKKELTYRALIEPKKQSRDVQQQFSEYHQMIANASPERLYNPMLYSEAYFRFNKATVESQKDALVTAAEHYLKAAASAVREGKCPVAAAAAAEATTPEPMEKLKAEKQAMPVRAAAAPQAEAPAVATEVPVRAAAAPVPKESSFGIEPSLGLDLQEMLQATARHQQLEKELSETNKLLSQLQLREVRDDERRRADEAVYQSRIETQQKEITLLVEEARKYLGQWQVAQSALVAATQTAERAEATYRDAMKLNVTASTDNGFPSPYASAAPTEASRRALSVLEESDNTPLWPWRSLYIHNISYFQQLSAALANFRRRFFSGWLSVEEY